MTPEFEGLTKQQKERAMYQIHQAIAEGNYDYMPYSEIVDIARYFINKVGGFEKFAEWGLV